MLVNILSAISAALSSSSDSDTRYCARSWAREWPGRSETSKGSSLQPDLGLARSMFLWRCLSVQTASPWASSLDFEPPKAFFGAQGECCMHEKDEEKHTGASESTAFYCAVTFPTKAYLTHRSCGLSDRCPSRPTRPAGKRDRPKRPDGRWSGESPRGFPNEEECPTSDGLQRSAVESGVGTHHAHGKRGTSQGRRRRET